MAALRELQAAAELELRRRDAEGLLDYIPRISPNKQRPKHLHPLVDALERSLTEPVFILCSVPPQFGKTETVIHGLSWRMRKRPYGSYGYVSFIAQVAEEKSSLCQEYARRAGVPMPPQLQAASHWKFGNGSGEMFATGIGGALTSRPISEVLVIDDPFKGREDAESFLERERVEQWMNSTAFPRCHPTTSIFVVHTRWHEDDLIGRLKKKLDADGINRRWECINLEAIDSHSGVPLWPEGRPESFLKQRRRDIGEYDWWALYMGSPRPKGGELFKGVQFYDTLPNRYRIGKGLDLGYTGTTRTDASAAVIIAEAQEDIYILDVAHARANVATFAPKLRQLDARFPGPWNFLCSSLEEKAIVQGSDDLKGININTIPTTTDKFVRAQPVASRWNGEQDETGKQIKPGRVFVPREAKWVPGFLEEIGKFTGVGDKADDQVDALGGAFWDFKDGNTARIYVPSATRHAYRFPDQRGSGF